MEGERLIKARRALSIVVVLLCLGTAFGVAIAPARGQATSGYFKTSPLSYAYPSSGYHVGGIFPGWWHYTIFVETYPLEAQQDPIFYKINGQDQYARYFRIYMRGQLVSEQVIYSRQANYIRVSVYWGWLDWYDVTFAIRWGGWYGYLTDGSAGSGVPAGQYNSWIWAELSAGPGP